MKLHDQQQVIALSQAQLGIWIAQQLDPNNPFFNIAEYVEIPGCIDEAHLARAVHEVVQASDALHQHFVPGLDGPYSYIAPVDRKDFPRLDLRTEVDPITAAQQWMHDDVNQAFDLEHDQLFTFVSLRLADAHYYLYGRVHHIVNDGFGSALFLRQIAEVYSALCVGTFQGFTPAGHWRDLVSIETIYRQSKHYHRDRAYWLEQMQSIEPAATLSGKPPGLMGTTYLAEAWLSRREAQILEQWGQAQGASLAQVIAAAVGHYLAAMTGKQDIVLGVPVTARIGATMRQIVGMVANILPLRLRIAPNATLSDLTLQTVRHMRALLRHQRYRDEDLHRDLGLGPNQPRLYSLTVNVNAFAYDLTFADQPTRVHNLGLNSRPATDLELVLFDNLDSNDIRVQLFGKIGHYTQAEVDTHLQRFLTLLHTWHQHAPDTPLNTLDILTQAERAQLKQWNATEAEYPQHLCLHQLFEQQVKREPNAIAVIFEGESLTYAELNRKANQLAYRLLALGVQPDDRVAICVERSLEMVVGLLGILKAGAAYVPLDPSYPDERLAHMLSDSGPVALLTQRALAERLSKIVTDMPCLMLDEIEASGVADATDNTDNPILPALTPSHLAYVIYTSGSTGQPKGVMVEHRQVGRLFAASASHFDFNADDVWALFHSFSFDFSVWEIWGALLHGGQLLIVSYLTSRSPEDCYGLLCKAGVTVLNQTPSAFRQFIAAQAKSQCVHRLRYVIFGGEALDTSILSPWYARQENAKTQLANMYGITEITVHATYCTITAEDARTGKCSIGHVLPDLQLHILDKAQQAVPIGAVSEIYIGGAGVARGYLNRPELTAERFLPDLQQPGARLYKTGDLGRYLSDGNIEYLGRNDDQVKIRGFRIELGEIESALRTHPSVREAVVLAQSDRRGELRLIAYLISSGEAVAAEELRSYLTKRLPEYMLPAAYVELKQWPLTTSGKLDRRALPEPEGDAYVSRVYEAPQSEVEQQLAVIWQDLLGVERVGRHDHFFELGGHSLMSVRLLARLRELGLSADLQALFAQPTLAAFAATIGHSDAVKVPPNRIPLGCTEITPEMLPLATLSAEEIKRVIATVPGGVENVQDIYALSPLQEGILYHHMASQQGDPYLQHILYSLQSKADLDTLLAALQQVINRHDILRSAVIWQGLSEPVQVVWRQATLPTEEVALDPAAGPIEQQLLAHFNPHRDQLDLQQAPLMCFFYAHDLANQRWVAMLCYHHLIGDGASSQLLFSELLACLHGHRLLESLPYRNYIAQARLGVSPEQHEAFFSQMLSDVEEPTLPYGLSDVRGDGRNIREVRQPLEADFSKRLRTQAHQLGVTPASLYHLAWARVVGALSGRDDVVFGTVLLGRMQGVAGIEQAMGMHINTLPVRLSVGTQPVSKAVRETHARLTALIKHEHASLALAQRCSGVQAPLPLFSTLLNYRHSAPLETEQAAWDGIKISAMEERTNYPLTLSVDDFGEGFDLVVQAVQEINAERVCGYMREALVSLVQALEQTPDRAINHLSLLPTEELAQLAEWNATEAEVPQHICIHQLFERQVKREPNATAVIFEGQSLTYDELNRKANQLAHRLLALGVQPDNRVAICVERSLEMVVGLLGILKAGAGYVPLDPAYPDDRLAYMLADSGPVALLTQRALAERLSKIVTDMPCLILDELEASGIADATDNTDNPILPALTPSHLAYVIYTSGSTGQPKGVMVEHRSVLNLLGTISPWFDLNSHDIYALFLSFAFDNSGRVIWGTLLHGAQLMIVPYSTVLSPQESYRLVCEAGVTVLTFTASVLRQLIEVQTTSPHQHRIRQVVLGGEVVDPSLLKGWYGQPENAQTQLFNEYGPTEATVYATIYRTKIADQTAVRVPIGRPNGNVRIHILDKAQQAAPIGAIGEIYIGGAGVARGYLNRPELTAARFLPDPFSQQPGARLYKTGDLGRYQPDGNIEFLGRNDDQVKIRGFRIELKEIESALKTYPLVREAVVLAKADRHGELRLIAYLIGSGEAVLAKELRSHLAKRLPEYMLPAAYVELKQWPLTTSGKLDRRALPEPEGGAYVSRVYEAPHGEVERQMAAIWQDLLGLECVGRQDHFFELGGHSLMSVRLLARLRELGLSADLQALFAQPTLAAFAATIGHSEAVEVPPNRIPLGCTKITPEMLPLATLSAEEIERVIATVPGGVENVQDIYALAPLQEGILYHHMASQQGDPYLQHILYSLQSKADLDALLAALQQVINRHDVLRSAVIWQGLSEPVQVVWRQITLPMEEVVLDPTAGPPEQQMLAHFNPRRDQLDLEQAPLMRLSYAYDPVHARWLVLWLCHHLVMDHVAIEVLFEELTLHLQGGSATLPAALPYRNYIVQARLGVSREQQEAFFSQMLSDVEEPTLPYGLTNVRGDGRGICEVRQSLEADLSKRLRTQAHQLGVTPASLHHLAWARVIGALSGRDDVVFGTLLLGRMQGVAGIEQAMGMYINTLPVRLSVGARPVSEAVRETHARLMALIKHEHASLALAQRCSGVPAPLPLFSSLLNYRHSTPLEISQTAWEGIEILSMEERTNYPLTLAVDDLGEGFDLVVQAVEEINAERVCGYMQEALVSIVRALAQTPDQAIHHLSLLPTEELAQLAKWNETEAEYPQHLCIHQLFEQQVEREPNATAVTFDGQSLTYGELNRQTNQLAHRLLALGVQPDDRVAICVERNLEMVVGLLGILKAGAAYVALDPAYPDERLTYMLTDSGPVVLLTQRALVERLGRMVMDVPCLMLDEREASGVADATGSAENPILPALTPSHLAYVIYTSGSTGQPKGVMVEHRSVLNLLGVTSPWFELKSHDVYALFPSFAFDASVRVIWGTLLHGAQLMIVPYSTILSPQACYQLICDAGVTVFTTTTGVLRQLIEIQRTSPHQHRIRQVVLGGDVIDPSLLKAWYGQLENTQTQLINEYGPTEATVYATFYRTKITDQTADCVPIGRPIGNTQIHILDKAQQAVPIGAVGEIYIGGAGVARGYLNRPELTAERFLPDPFTQQPEARIYKTGDLGRYHPDGNIEFLGRNDDQIKIRGFRIELKEIESALRSHSSVREAVVLAKSDRHEELRLIAYVIPHGEAASAKELRNHLAKRLPEYMLPAAYVVLEEWPLTTSGKLDHRALPDPEGGAYVSRVYEAPQGEVERQLAAIWQDLLRVERVGRHDHFFELGGHSLMSVRLLARLREQGLSADLQSLFAEPTLAAFAATIGHSEAVEVPPNLIPLGCTEITPEMLPLATLSQAEIERVIATVPGGVENVQDIYALAPLQEGILYHHMASQQGDPYLQHILYSLQSKADLDALLAALQQVINRHDVLRSAVIWQGLSEPVQVVWRQTTLPMEEVVLDPTAGRPEQQMLAHFNPRRDQLDLEQAPLMRLSYAYDPVHARWLVQWLCHHLMMDHVAIAVLVEELTLHLQGGSTTTLPTSMPYRNYIAQARLGVSREQHEAFFSRMLSDVEEPTLPYGLADVHGDGRGICEVRQSLEADLSKRLRTQARQLGVTPASLHHLAWARVVGALSGRDDVVFGTVLLGRMQGAAGIEQAIGIYINTLPVRLSVGAQPTSEAVRETHARLTTLIKHEHASLALAQRCSGVPAPLPLFSTLLNYRHSTPLKTEQAACDGIRILAMEERSNYPLTLSVDDFGEEFDLVVQAVEEINAERVCGYMREALVSLVRTLEQTSDQAINHLSLLPTEELAQLKQWNATEAEYPQHLCLHQLFEQQVERNPNAIAVISEGRSLTYSELNAQANQLAHRLLALGVQPDDRVAICVERSLEMVVGLLGILKAGAGYVPLDPAYPDERLAYMLADSEPVVLLTQKALAERLGRMVIDNVPSLMLDELEASSVADATGNADNPILPALTPSHLAYVIYTSGSTGQPKGVMVEHRSVLNLLGVTSPWFELKSHDVYALFPSFAFDASVRVIWGTLLHGAQLMIVPYSTILSPQACYQLICDAGVTVFTTTTGVLRQLIEIQRTSPHQHRIRQVILGGDVIDPLLLESWYGQPENAHTQIINEYGPTEATVYATFYRTKIADQTADCVPIGRPIGNTQIHILDKVQQAVPIGAVGEIYIGGAGVARGYLNRPELTAARFLSDPFSQQPGARIYKTGDLGRYLPDGNIEFLGRNDDQVKIRGFRIELKEIELALKTHPLVREAVVLAKADQQGELRLIAYLIFKGEAASAKELRNHLAKRLPEYMLPAAYVELEQWPLTTNGKLDRRALPEPMQEKQVSSASRTPHEHLLCELFAEVLDIPHIGIDNNFFELGGNSLSAMRMINKINSAFGLHLSIHSIFEAPNVRELAPRLIEDNCAGSAFETILPLRKRGKLPPLFCIHPVYGLSWCYSGLIHSLHRQRPLYGIQARGFLEPKATVQDMAGLARDYVRAMRMVQPEGPYLLLGWSFGGLVAHEMACQLQAADAEVELLALMDSYPILPDILASDSDEQEPHLLRKYAEELNIALSPEEITDLNMTTFVKAARRANHILGCLEERDTQRLVELRERFSRLIPTFQPGRLAGDMLFFQAMCHKPHHLANNILSPNGILPQAWQPYVDGKIQVYPMNYTHNEMANPTPIREIGRKLEHYLHGEVCPFSQPGHPSIMDVNCKIMANIARIA